jgi:predicted metal-binding protein
MPLRRKYNKPPDAPPQAGLLHGSHAARVERFGYQGFGRTMPVEIIVCTTCKYGPDAAFDARGRTGGEILAEAVAAAAGNRSDAIRVIRHECLWACRNSCAVLIQSPGKTGYLAGRFEADAEAAASIVDWAQAYGQSADGTVPYAVWPEGMKGHFIARIPTSGGLSQ